MNNNTISKIFSGYSALNHQEIALCADDFELMKNNWINDWEYGK